MDDKQLLTDSILINVLSTDISDVNALKDKIYDSMAQYTVTKLKSILPSINNGEVTRSLFLEFSQSKYNQGMNQKTLLQYWRAVEKLCDFCHKEAHLITAEDIKDYLTYFRRKNVKLTTIKHNRTLLSSFYTFLYRNHYINENPIERVECIRAVPEPKKPLTKKEIEMVLCACESQEGLLGIRNRALITFLLDTGVRVSELCNIKINDVNFDEKTLIVNGKGGKFREVYFTDATTVRLQEYFAARTDFGNGKNIYNAPLFGNIKNGTPLTPAGVEFAITTIGKISGVTRIHPHLLRANFATNLIDKGVPLTIVSDMMGHCSVSTTQIYVKLSNTSKKRYIDMVS